MERIENLSDTSVFIAVVEHGSFTAAADTLSLSKAVVSKYVSRLEQRLAARLLNRTTRRLTLTEAGELLYARASVALADLDAAEAAVLELTGHPRGRLRLTAPSHFGQVFLAPLFGEFRRRYPDVQLDIDLDNRLVDLVREGFDVGIRISSLPNSSMVSRTLAKIRIVTVASPDYLARRGTPQAPDDLRDHECLTYGLDPPRTEWRYALAPDRPIGIRVGGGFRCNSDGALKRAALDGLGILRFPELFVLDELRSGRLVVLLQPYEMHSVSLSAIFPTRQNLAPKVRVFVDFVAEHFSGDWLGR